MPDRHNRQAAANGDPGTGLLRWALVFLRPYRGRIPWMVGLLLFDVALGALQPWPLKIVIDYVLDPKHPPLPGAAGRWLVAASGGNLVTLLIVFVVAGVVLQLLGQFVSAWNTQLQVDTGHRMVYDLRARLLEHLESLGLRHHLTTSVGDAVYRVDVDAWAIENLVMSAVFPLATSVTTLLVMFVILLNLDVAVACLSLTIVPFLYLCLRYYTTTLVEREERTKSLEVTLIERLHETFSAIRLIKSFAREQAELKRYVDAGQRAMQARIAVTWQQSMFSVAVTAVTILGTALILIVGGIRVMQGRMTVGSIMVVTGYLAAVYGPLSAIAHTMGQVQGAVAGARRVRTILAMTPEDADPPGAVDATAIRGTVAFEDVSFSYGDKHAVLQGISFEAKPGQMIALVGLTGAGKTTLASLIPRFFEATSGRVLIDGRDVREYRIRSLREKIALVPQDALLLSGTIASNLRYGRLDATDEEVEAAARAAHAHDFIARLSKQYDTDIAEAGAGLSGGERQRLSVARAILKNAPILILDEPTSSLDAISEEIVFAALRRLRAGRTTIVIAHRLSTIRDADCILVLDGGRIAARGRHDELLATNQLYRRMCARLSVGRSLDEPESVDELIQAATAPGTSRS
jgi:ATP-binding cassette subfamily B protein